MTQAPRPAATLILLRPGGDGVEVLMIQRAKSAAFLGGAYVFPGGALDAADSDLKRRILGSLPPEPPAEYYIAAVRECFEEAGVALLCGRNGKQISSSHAEKLMHLRTRPFIELLEKEDLYIPAGELVYYANWITAPGRSRRTSPKASSSSPTRLCGSSMEAAQKTVGASAFSAPGWKRSRSTGG